jgi:hypothetical protein
VDPSDQAPVREGLNQRPGPPEVNHRPDEILDELRQSIERNVAVGLLPEHEIVAQMMALFSDRCEVAETLRPEARRLARAAVKRHQQEQQSWPTPTDCDRLDAAFAALEHSGILCRQDYAPCDEYCEELMADDIEAAENSGRRVRGYAYITMLATDDALAGRGLKLRFGAWPNSHIAEADIGLEVASALQRHGLKVLWDGGRQTPILVDMGWKKRRMLTWSRRILSESRFAVRETLDRSAQGFRRFLHQPTHLERFGKERSPPALD